MNEYAEQLEQALQIACAAHAGQADKADRPYILHPLRIMHKLGGKMKDREDGDLILAAAILHDVVEDTPITLDMLREDGFDPKIIHLVELLTHTKDDGLTYRLTYREYIMRLKDDPDAVLIKLGDLYDNLFHPARREGWKGEDTGKRRYIGAWFFLTEGVWH